MKYNVVWDDGEASSVTVFDGTPGGTVATKDHPNFSRILATLQKGGTHNVADLFDIAKPLANKFAQLSERVSVGDGMIYFDHDPVDNALTEAILRFYEQGNEDFKPLVSFMEKISDNPNLHSRMNLFRWLGKHKFAIAADGDLIAYKGVGSNFKSQTSGEAIVNGVKKNGQIPNDPGTVVEMPRSKVTFDPRNGCSTGLHVANWSFARGFTSSGTVLRVKVNPRDVVSVPVDAGDQKMRVCRYHVVDQVQSEDQSALFADAVPTKRAAKVDTKVEKSVEVSDVHPLPEHYENFKKVDFEKLPYNELRWLAKEWDVPRHIRRKTELVSKLARKASSKRRKK